MTTVEHRQAEQHRHTHGPGCGHAAVVHGDHVDYLHDGHAHREHATEGGVHYDECTACSCDNCNDVCAVCDCADCTCPTSRANCERRARSYAREGDKLRARCVVDTIACRSGSTRDQSSTAASRSSTASVRTMISLLSSQASND